MPESAISTCKCCGAGTTFFANVDAARTCEDRGGKRIFPPSTELVEYRRCLNCGFVFTGHFDTLDDAGMAACIYNSDYILADPEFAETRPRYFADMLGSLLLPLREDLRALDYGGGAGLLAEVMRERGFNFESYDPYFAAAQATPGSGYDLVTAFEVFEHTRDPRGTLEATLDLVQPDGAVLFSTQLRPPDADGGWWYVAPRNGHVSLYAERSLHRLARSCGARFLALGSATHLVWRGAAGRAAHLIVARQHRDLLYSASRRGVIPFVRAARTVAQLGFVPEAANPRHIARSMLATARWGRRT